MKPDQMPNQTTKTKTRGKQAGGIYKRKNGLWIGSIELGYANGKRKRKSVAATTKAELLTKLDTARQQISGGVRTPELLTIKAVIDEWLQGLESSESVKSTTIANYRNVANRYILPFVGHKRLADFKVADVEKMLSDLQGAPQKPQVERGVDPAKLASVEEIASILESMERPKLPVNVKMEVAVERLQRAGYAVKSASGGNDRDDQALKRPDIRRAISLRKLRTKTGVSGNTRRLARTVLRMALLDAQRKEYVVRNVASLARGPKVDDAYQGRTLTPDQARALISTVADHRIESYIVVGVSLGLRPGETLALRWDDIDFENKTLAVTGTLARTKDGLVRQTPKTSKSRRILPLPKATADALQRQRKRQLEQRLAAGPVWTEFRYVLTNEIGGPLHPASARNVFKRLTAELFGESWRPHEMRHSAASLLLAQGVPLRTISDILGHSSIQITSDVYGHMLASAHADVLNRLSVSITG